MLRLMVRSREGQHFHDGGWRPVYGWNTWTQSESEDELRAEAARCGFAFESHELAGRMTLAKIVSQQAYDLMRLVEYA